VMLGDSTLPADAVVPDRLADVGGEDFLPRLAVVDLIAVGEAVAVGIDPARLFPVVDHAAGTRGVVAVAGERPVGSVPVRSLDRCPPDGGVVPLVYVVVGATSLDPPADGVGSERELLEVAADQWFSGHFLHPLAVPVRLLQAGTPEEPGVGSGLRRRRVAQFDL